MKRCHKCGGAFIWEQNENDKWFPADPMTGKPHWMNCTKPKKPRPKPRSVVATARLFSESDNRLRHLLEAG